MDNRKKTGKLKERPGGSYTLNKTNIKFKPRPYDISVARSAQRAKLVHKSHVLENFTDISILKKEEQKKLSAIKYLEQFDARAFAP